MTFETQTSLGAAEVLERAKSFFTTRIPAQSAFVEKETDRHLVMRGQGGEEVVFAVMPGQGATRVRGSSLLFDQQIKRFYSTLPAAPGDQDGNE